MPAIFQGHSGFTHTYKFFKERKRWLQKQPYLLKEFSFLWLNVDVVLVNGIAVFNIGEHRINWDIYWHKHISVCVLLCSIFLFLLLICKAIYLVRYFNIWPTVFFKSWVGFLLATVYSLSWLHQIRPFTHLIVIQSKIYKLVNKITPFFR